MLVLLISMANSMQNPLFSFPDKERFSAQTMFCTLAAYCLRRAAIKKGSPYDPSEVTITSLSVRESIKAREVGARIRLRRQREPEGVKPRPAKKPKTFSPTPEICLSACA